MQMGVPGSPQVPAGYVSAHSCQESGDLGCTGSMGRQENCNGKEREEGKGGREGNERKETTSNNRSLAAGVPCLV